MGKAPAELWDSVGGFARFNELGFASHPAPHATSRILLTRWLLPRSPAQVWGVLGADCTVDGSLVTRVLDFTVAVSLPDSLMGLGQFIISVLALVANIPGSAQLGAFFLQ